MPATTGQPFGKLQRTPVEEPRSTNAPRRPWRKAVTAMLLSGLAMLVHRALVPKPRKTTSDGTGSDGGWFDSSTDGAGGGDGGGD